MANTKFVAKHLKTDSTMNSDKYTRAKPPMQVKRQSALDSNCHASNLLILMLIVSGCVFSNLVLNCPNVSLKTPTVGRDTHCSPTLIGYTGSPLISQTIFDTSFQPIHGSYGQRKVSENHRCREKSAKSAPSRKVSEFHEQAAK